MSPTDPYIGSVLQDRYRIISFIATGSMGAVYKGERTNLGRPVAVKFLHAPYATRKRFVRRFQLEAQAMSRLSHPNCVSIIDYGVADTPYLVMDLVQGKSLKDLIKQGPIPIPRTLHIFRQVLAALAHAHGNEVVHRDIKPANIVLTEATGTGDHIKILDFGLAKLRDGALLTGESTGAMVLGTPNYMSPEQTRAGKVDVRSDIYSAGVMLYEMLTGRKPFDAVETEDLLRMHLEQPPPGFAEVAPDRALSWELEAVVKRAIAKAPDDRFQSALEFASALAATPEAALPMSLSEPTAASEQSSGSELLPSTETVHPASRPWWRRGPVLLVAAVLCLAVAGLGLLWKLRETPPVEDALAGTTPPPAPEPKPEPKAEPKPEPKAEPKPEPRAAQNPDASPEPEPEPEPDSKLTQKEKPGAKAEPSPAAAEDLIEAGKVKQAMAMLHAMRAKHPRSGEIPYLMGRANFKRRWWLDGMRQYAVAVQRDPRYKRNRRLNEDIIGALMDPKTSPKAIWIIRRYLGREALPHLRRAAEEHPSDRVRLQARWLAEKIEAEK